MTKDLSSLSRWLNIKEEESANGISLQQLESGLKAIESKLTEKEVTNTTYLQPIIISGSAGRTD